MKVSDYIVEFFISKGITDVFGYPGGMTTHLMDSFNKYKDSIKSHVNYHEQASSFAACGYAQSSLKPGVAYATSGPGATNMVTGICNAYFDSIPVIFVTGQVNTYESKEGLNVRQKGFQETDIVTMTNICTKYSTKIVSEYDIKYELEKAYSIAMSGRPGPVLLDIPMNIQRMEINLEDLKSYEEESIEYNVDDMVSLIYQELEKSKKPCILAGAAIQNSGMVDVFRKLISNLKIPVVTSMIAIDTINRNDEYNFGFIGAYGMRYSNFILSKCDLVITLGTRLDVRQTGVTKENFATNAKIIRIDIDEGELTNKIHKDEIQLISDLKTILPNLYAESKEWMAKGINFYKWLDTCNIMKKKLANIDERYPNKIIRKLSECIPSDSIITTDVGQNQVWIAQSIEVDNMRVLFSGGHGAMGYSLPASIGAYYGTKKNVISCNGDGGIQMNLQELQFIAREKLPITILIFNNYSLGMIRHFQEMYFDKNYVQTNSTSGYTVPDMEKIAFSYGIDYHKINKIEEMNVDIMTSETPKIIEIELSDTTYVFPKLAVGKLNQDQEPEIDRDLYKELESL
ncbi:thiamine pyrophosphate-binding protein [Clostridioides sp. ZZV14-6345]|uniref:thiamine pyrophosphate-binding protein n=1 Tax=Clostridioides sp. ZZV14-6345 TaxID=2811496 RepID=UPI001D0FA1ED|nr:thiamine pyrophosphate-binding protein [Clostridioides sp. ZZV14-6345]